MVQKIITILFLSGDPLTISNIANILGVQQKEIEDAIEETEKSLFSVGLNLLHNGDELSIVTQSAYAQIVASFWQEELKGELSPAALQVFTLVAYLGNPTREEISYVRGVQSSQSIRSLTVRGLISRTGEVCALTTDAFKYLGITKSEELPDYESTYKNLKDKLSARET